MSAEEIIRFESEPFHQDAIRVRRWDDLGKVVGLLTPAVADYRGILETAARSATESGRCATRSP